MGSLKVVFFLRRRQNISYRQEFLSCGAKILNLKLHKKFSYDLQSLNCIEKYEFFSQNFATFVFNIIGLHSHVIHNFDPKISISKGKSLIYDPFTLKKIFYFANKISKYLKSILQINEKVYIKSAPHVVR